MGEWTKPKKPKILSTKFVDANRFRATHDFLEAADWIAWSQRVSDKDLEAATTQMIQGLIAFSGSSSESVTQRDALSSEMGRLYAERMRRQEPESRDFKSARDKALQYFATAAQREPDNRANFVETVRMQRELGEFADAETMYAMWFDWAAPEEGGEVSLSAYHYQNLGDIYAGLSHYEFALACYRKALEAMELEGHGGKIMHKLLSEKVTAWEEMFCTKADPALWDQIVERIRSKRVDIPAAEVKADGPAEPAAG